jgi:hypothetical protein
MVHEPGHESLTAGPRVAVPKADRACFMVETVDLATGRVQRGTLGVGFGHAKVGASQVLLRGYNRLVATISTRMRPR